MKKLMPFLFAFLLLSPVFADGAMSAYHSATGSWQISREARQLAAINYQGGQETMLIAVEPSNLEGSKLVWIFPVPAKPDDVKMALSDKFPAFSGTNVEKKAAESGQLAGAGLISSQVYLLPFSALLGSFPGMSGGTKDGPPGALGAAENQAWYEDYVEVHATLQKNGLKAELVDSKMQGALYYYLQGKGLGLPYEMQEALDGYFGKDYSFVVAYIDDVPGYNALNGISGQANPGYYGYQPLIAVSVEFPTDRIYFPLVPTSVYKDATVPAWIYVMGHVTPELYPLNFATLRKLPLIFSPNTI